MSMQEDTSKVQRLYPLLYVACHAIHGRELERAGTLSARECAVLSHLHAQPSLSASTLAKHLGLARSTLSEVVLRMVELGFLDALRDERDERRKRLVVTDAGQAALSSVEVLDERKLATVLARLTEHERVTVIEGLDLLAKVVGVGPQRA